MKSVRVSLSNKRTVVKLLLVALVLFALPLTLILVRQAQDQQSEASYDVEAYIEKDERIVLEAETFDENLTNETSYNWTKKDDGPYPEFESLNILSMQSLPNDDVTLYVNNPSPELKYNIWITNPGTYYAFIRSSAPGENADSIHVGIDGGQKTNMGTYYIGKFGYESNWSWDGNGGPVALNISTPGLHTFHIWARETGAKIDRVNLTKDASWEPGYHSNRGPGESDRQSVSVGSPTPVPCTQQKPQISVEGDVNRDVVAGESVQFNINVTNANSAECGPATFNMTNVFDPTTNNVTVSFSETSVTLNSGESKQITVTFTPNNSVAGSTITANVTAAQAGSGLSTTTKLVLNILAGSTTLNFNKIVLHGIGIGGDNANPNGQGNQNPNTKTKSLKVRIFNAGGNLMTEKSGNIQYDSTKGYFTGSVTIDSSLNSGLYIIKVITHKYLVRQLTGIITISGGEINNMPAATLEAGDINSDEQTTLVDYDILIGCYSDLLPATDCDPTRKFNADLTDDGKVNQDDYNFLLREWSNQLGA